jgi:succinyl-diaminopimelate desuccinylase
MEPTNGAVEAGCQGTMRVAWPCPAGAPQRRSWLGENAIHAAAPLLTRLVAYDPREVEIDGCTYREGLNAVSITGGVAGNVIPDACTVLVNFRFAPDRTRRRRTTTCARCSTATRWSCSTAPRARCPG